MATPARTIHELALLELDELPPVPYEDVSYRWSLEQAEKLYPYVDDALHEFMGRGPLEITVKLWFDNSLVAGLYPDVWKQWRDSLFEGAPHVMVHPDFGTRDVVHTGGDLRLVAQHTSGVVVNATFRTTLLDPETALPFESISLTLEEAAAKADAACGNLGVEFPDGFVELSLREFAAQLKSFKSFFELSVLNVAASWQGIIETMDDAVMGEPDIHGHTRIEAHTALVTLWSQIERIKERATLLQRPTAGLITDTPTTLTQFAEEHGMSLQEAMQLNPAALASPQIPVGTGLKFFA